MFSFHPVNKDTEPLFFFVEKQWTLFEISNLKV